MNFLRENSMKRTTPILLIAVLACGGLMGKERALDPNTFVVVGGGLSAGCSNLVLTDQSQQAAYPVLMARQMRTLMSLANFRDGGITRVVSFGSATPAAPKANQSTLRGLPFPLFTLNPSVPFLKLSESLNLRPSMPIAIDGDAKRTTVNLIVGYPALIFPGVTPWTQIEYAENMFPTFVVVELGSGDVLDAALQGDSSRITSLSSFSTDYQTIVTRMSNTFASLLLMNVPDPTDTAYFSTIQKVAGIYQLSTQELISRFGLQPGDLITPGGLVEIGDTLSGRRREPLSASSILRAQVAAAVQDAVRSYNSAIATIASAKRIPIYDLAAFYKELRAGTVQAGSAKIGGGYLEGFFSEDGIFPTAIGQALLANRLLQFTNSSFGTQFPLLDIDKTVPQAAPEPTEDNNPIERLP